MNNTNFNEAVEIALRTWYREEDPLHLNPHHPLGKLIGEWGELMNNQMKSYYKPGYIPETKSKLGDIWYYTRIGCYQLDHTPQTIKEIVFDMSEKSTYYVISYTLEKLGQAFRQLENYGFFWSFPLDTTFTVLKIICKRNDITLDQLTKSNNKRREQWMATREDTDYYGGKVTKRDV